MGFEVARISTGIRFVAFLDVAECSLDVFDDQHVFMSTLCMLLQAWLLGVSTTMLESMQQVLVLSRLGYLEEDLGTPHVD